MSDRIAAEYDPVTCPSHYCRGGLEAKDVIAAFLADVGPDVDPVAAYWYGCAMKYVLRWPYKGAEPRLRLQDIDKAVECLTECKRAYEAHQTARRGKVDDILGRD